MRVPAAARGLRQSVERAGGSMVISVSALGDAFGRGKVTPRSRAGIEMALASAGVAVVPRLTSPEAADWVTLQLAELAAPQPAAAYASPAAPVPPAAYASPAAAAAPHAPAPAAAAPHGPAPAGAAPHGPAPAGAAAAQADDDVARMSLGALIAGLVGTVLGFVLGSATHAVVLGVLAWAVVFLVRARGEALRAALAPRLPRPLRAPTTLGAATFALPALVLAALVLAPAGSDTEPERPAAPTRTAPVQDARSEQLARAERAFAEGDYLAAMRLTRAADPARVPDLRTRIAGALLVDARAALAQRRYVRAVQLAKRAQRYGRAPGVGEVLREGRAGLDRRRARQRRAAAARERRAAAREAEEEAAAAAPPATTTAEPEATTTTP